MKLLICDDEDLIRRTLARAFKAQGHEVTEAIHGGVALELLEKQTFDLIILDLLMPEKNGFDVLDALVQPCPVIIISAFSGQQQGDFQSDKYPQVIGFIKKPFEHLLALVSQVEGLYENYIRKI